MGLLQIILKVVQQKIITAHYFEQTFWCDFCLIICFIGINLVKTYRKIYWTTQCSCRSDL